MAPHLSLILLVPLAGALALLLVPRHRDSLIRWLAAGTSMAAFAAAVPLWLRYDAGSAEFQFIERLPWIPPFGAEYFLGVDGFGVALILLTTVISAAAGLIAWRQEPSPGRSFYACLLLYEGAALGAFMALDLLLFFLCATLALVPMYVQVRARSGARAGVRFARVGAVASLAQLIAILAIAAQHRATTGRATFDMTAFHQLDLPFATESWILLVSLLGFAILPAIIALLGIGAVPAAMAVLAAAVGVKIGTYGLLRVVLPILPEASSFFAGAVRAAAAAGMIVAAILAFSQRDRQRMAGWLAVSYTAALTAGMFALAEPAIAASMALHVAHGLAMASLMALIDLKAVGRPGLRSGFAATFVIAATTLAGVPFLAGFIGDRAIVSALWSADKWSAALIVAGLASAAAATAALCVRSLSGGTVDGRREIRVVDFGPAVALLALSIWMGVSPAPMLGRLKIAAHHVASHVDPASGDAAECDTVPTPEQLAATPGSQFLLAVPCGPDGQPLPDGGK